MANGDVVYTQITNSLGYQSTYSWQQTSIDVAGTDHLVERHQYTANSLMPDRTYRPSVNPEGERLTKFTFDANHRPLRIIEHGYTPVFSAAGAGGIVTEGKDHIPAVTTYKLIERQSDLVWEGDRLVAIDCPRSDVGDLTHLHWDEKNRLVAILPPVSPALRMTKFDALGRITRYQLDTRPPIELSYNNQGKVIESRQGEKILWLDYDENQRLSMLRHNDGHVITLSFDSAGRITSITDEMGRKTTWSHDTESRPVHRAAIGIDGTMIRTMENLFDERGDLTRRRDERAGGSVLSVQVLDYEHSASDGALQVSDTSTGARVSTVIDQVSRIATLTGVDSSVTQVQFDAKVQLRV